MTHTYAVMEVTSETYQEISDTLLKGGYNEAFHTQDDDTELIILHGLAMKKGPRDLTQPPPPETPVEYHPVIVDVLRFFSYQHLPPHLQEVSKACCVLAEQMARTFPQSGEAMLGLRKLLESKDCFVRAALP